MTDEKKAMGAFAFLMIAIVVSTVWIVRHSEHNPPGSCAQAIDRCAARLGCSFAREMCQ